MQGARWTAARESASEVGRVLVGIVLLVLVIGIWVWLWVPPSPAF